MLYAIFAVLVIILDQGVKYWVSGHVALNVQTVPFIPDILSIVNVRNDGAAFSFLAGSNARMYFIILTGVFTLAVIVMLATKFISGPLARWSIVLVTAGGLSNCIDRVIYGYVQDMFKCEFVNFPVFNVADVFITVFALLFVLAILFGRDHRKDDYDFDEEYGQDDEEDEEEEEEPPRRARKEKKQRRSRRAAKEEEEDEDDEDEEEDEDEDEEEDERPARRRGLFGGRRASRYDEEDEEDEDEDEDEEDDEDEYVKPAPRRRAREEAPERRKRQSKYAAEFEKAKARKQANAAPQSEEAPAAEPRRYEPEARRYEPEARRYEPEARSDGFRLPAQEVDPSRLEARPAAAPARQSEAPRAYADIAPAKPSAPAEDDFDLESILAEFK